MPHTYKEPLQGSRRPSRIMRGIATMVLCTWAIPQSAPAAKSNDRGSTPEVVFKKLAPPVVTSVMVMAQTFGGPTDAGDVILKLSVHPDGTIESITPVSGNRWLTQAAVESARQSQFECRGCQGLTEKSLIYSFKSSPIPAGTCCCTAGHPDSQIPDPEVSEVNGHVIFIASPICVCPDSCSRAWAGAHLKFRSPKCFYLWKCGKRRVYIQ